MYRLFVTLLISACAYAEIFPYNISTLPHKTPLKHIKILDQKALDLDKISGVPFAEISDLGYAPKQGKLYMLNDKGRLFVFRAKFDDNISITPLSGHYLHPKGKQHLKHADKDSEGLTLDGAGKLWASFERKPRIAQIDPDGRIIRYADLPASLPTLKQMRGRNKGLESLAWHPRYGLITAIEYPPRKTPLSHQTLYSLSGKKWHFRLDNLPHAAITAIETMDDGNILALIRSYDKKNVRFTIELVKVYIDKSQGSNCQTKVLARLSTDDGWALDNFEGLTRISPHRYLMVSDNGGAFPRKTLLVYFEVIVP